MNAMLLRRRKTDCTISKASLNSQMKKSVLAENFFWLLADYKKYRETVNFLRVS